MQAVDYGGLLECADRNDAVLRLDFRSGDFVVSGDQRVLLAGPGIKVTDLVKELTPLLITAEARTPTQDLEFAIRHLEEVALRALSPGINDPFTAIAVIDRLRGALSKLMARQLPSELVPDKSGRPRILRQVTTYDGALDAAFHQIRQAASSKPAVLIQLLEALARIAEHTRLDEQRAGLKRHADLIRTAAERDVPEPADRRDVDHSFERAVQAIAAAAR